MMSRKCKLVDSQIYGRAANLRAFRLPFSVEQTDPVFENLQLLRDDLLEGLYRVEFADVDREGAAGEGRHQDLNRVRVGLTIRGRGRRGWGRRRHLGGCRGFRVGLSRIAHILRILKKYSLILFFRSSEKRPSFF